MARSYGLAIFSPGLEEVLLIKREDPQGPSWSFPFAPAEATSHLAAATAAVKELIGTDVSGKITRNWIEVEVSNSRSGPGGCTCTAEGGTHSTLGSPFPT